MSQKMSKKSLYVIVGAGLFIALLLSASAYQAYTKPQQLVSDQYGTQFFMGNDPLAVYTDGAGVIKMMVFASAPYPSVYFTATFNGQTLASGYGTGHDNVVELDVPISGVNYPANQVASSTGVVGDYVIQGTAQVNGNPVIQNSAEVLIIDRSVVENAAASFNAVQAASTPNSGSGVDDVSFAQLNIEVHDAPSGDSFNLVSVFDGQNNKVALSQTTKSEDGSYFYARLSVAAGASYTVQVECPGYVTQAQSVTFGDTGSATVTFNMQALSNPTDSQGGQGVAVGQMPTGELNTQAVHVDRSVWDWIVWLFTGQWL